MSPVPVTELATVLARGYVRLLAARVEKALSDAISAPQNLPNPLEVPGTEWPPVVRRENTHRARP